MIAWSDQHTCYFPCALYNVMRSSIFRTYLQVTVGEEQLPWVQVTPYYLHISVNLPGYLLYSTQVPPPSYPVFPLSLKVVNKCCMKSPRPAFCWEWTYQSVLRARATELKLLLLLLGSGGLGNLYSVYTVHYTEMVTTVPLA